MMIKIPAQHQTDPAKAAGRHVSPVEDNTRSAVNEVTLGDSLQRIALQEDKTLSDYIARKTRNDAFNAVKKENKITFDEWYSYNCGL